MKRMRVLVLRSASSYGGPERQIIGFASRLNRSRYRSLICGFADDGGDLNPFLLNAASAGLETAIVPSSSGFDRRSIAPFVQMVRSGHIDLLCPQDYRSRVYALIAGQSLGIPVTATVHGYTGHTPTVRAYEAIDRLVALRLAQTVICVSTALHNRLLRYGISAQRMHVLHNSVDTADVPVATNHALAPTACCVARLSVEKGHRFLINAWPRVLERVPSAELVLVGDGPERGALGRHVAALGLTGSVRFAGFAEDPGKYLAAASVFVLPSLREGLPVAVLEACAASKPVVASDVGGVGEVVAHGWNGILVPSKRPSELSVALIVLLTNPDLSRQMGQRGRDRVEREFSYETNARLLERIYDASLQGSQQ